MSSPTKNTPSAKSISVCAQEMSTDINDLPQEISALVFQAVPFSTIGQCRAVCKEWNSLIMNPAYSDQFEKPDVPKLMLVANDPVDGWSIRVHNSESDIWVPVSLPFLQDAPQVGPHYLTASSGGLMCFETQDRRSFIICNPLTRKWRQLQLPVVEDDSDRRTCSCLNPLYCRNYIFTMPCTPGALTTLTGLIVDEATGSYKLVAASLAKSGEKRTFVFDSVTLSWTKGAEMPIGTKFLNPVALTVDKNLYCLLGSDAGKRVARYEVERDSWCWSNPLVADIVPHFRDRMELELVKHKDGVKVLGRDVGREYRAYARTPVIERFSDVKVLSVLEFPGRIEVIPGQRHDRNNRTDVYIRNQLLSAYVFGSIYRDRFFERALAAYSSSAFASSVAYGKTLYVLGVLEEAYWKEERTFHVLKFDDCTGRTSLLASFEMEKFQEMFGVKKAIRQTQVELRLFQPSLVAQV